MPDKSKTQIIVAILGVAGALGAAVIANWDKILGSGKSAESSRATNPLPTPAPCRDKSHGVERYARTFDVDRTSPWMGGGFSQDPWCNQVVGELRGQNPEGAFEVMGKSEDKKNTCAPFNCPQYQYYCKVRVKADPIYVEKLSSACK